MLETPEQEISLSDPDARSMKTRGGGVVGYNVQTAVDTEHHLIVSHEVINEGSDRSQLSPMAERASAATGIKDLTVIADRGYYKNEEILSCERSGISAMVPKSLTSNNTADGLFDKRDFVYIAEDDEYRCPAGQRLTKRFETLEHGMTMYGYYSSVCNACSLKDQCTTGRERRVRRWEHEEVLEAMQARLDRNPQAMRIRRETVEHPFGTIKAWMGATHFLMKTLPKVRTEMSLHVLAYNLKRVMKIVGIGPLLSAIRRLAAHFCLLPVSTAAGYVTI